MFGILGKTSSKVHPYDIESNIMSFDHQRKTTYSFMDNNDQIPHVTIIKNNDNQVTRSEHQLWVPYKKQKLQVVQPATLN